MKFFSEFSCCGGATVTPAVESSSTTLRRNEASSRSMKVKYTAHWKPALSAISEDGVVSDIGNRKIENTVASQKKTCAKAKSTAMATSPYDYRKDSMLMAIPAFAPTPYLF